jgi:hypothetical protein
VDFAVGRVDQKKVKPPVGVFFEDGKKELRTREDEDEEEDTASDIYESKVYVRRLGTVAVPVTILVEREGESPIREEWDGKEHFTVLNYKGGKVTRVVVDPDQTWLIDLDFRNNTWMDEKDREPSLRWSERTLLWMQNMLMFYGSLT